jgi:thiamine biosynthesis lipoprotein
VTDYLVGVGGEMKARGVSHLGRPWRVGIQTPTPGTRRILYEVDLSNFCLSTSGDYHNYFDKDGHRYCHEIDPATGRPAARTPASVSVAHPDGAYADAMATALMVLGPDRGFELAQRLHLAVLMILRDDGRFQTRATPEFQTILVGDPK